MAKENIQNDKEQIIMAEKMDGKTMNITQENIAKMQELFPEVFTEGKIDFDKLQVVLGENIDKSNERYEFSWNGKFEAMKLAQLQSTGTLIPCKEKSKDWDKTQNLYIEGDNLEVLKLLQKSYVNQIKMIYIDPPYNTGNDFVYKDNFADNIANYKEVTGQATKSNAETAGRYHTNWLNMMYPRLKLARNLLKDDGVIFISMDDHEFANLKKICDEIFGENNFVCNFVWEKGKEGGNDSSIMRSHYDNILCYCKNSSNSNVINLDKKDTSRHITEDREENLVAGIENEINKGELFQLVNLSKQKDYTVNIPLKDGTVIEWPSYAPQKSINEWIKIGKVFVGAKRVPYIKSYLKDELQGQKPSNIITQEFGTTKAGSIEIRDFFGSREIFSYPKPSVLLKRLLEMGSTPDSIILDFFSGSATMAQSVMRLNSEDLGNRRYILVQLPENTEYDSEAKNLGFNNLCEIGEERIRRAGQKIIEEHPELAQSLDVGFKVFKLESSNLVKWDNTPTENVEELEQRLQQSLFYIVNGRTNEDLVYEIMLKYGLPLTLPIYEKQFGENKAYIVESDTYKVMICLDRNLSIDTIEQMTDEPIGTYVFADHCFADANALINTEEILKKKSKNLRIF